MHYSIYEECLRPDSWIFEETGETKPVPSRAGNLANTSYARCSTSSLLSCPTWIMSGRKSFITSSSQASGI